MEFLFSKNLRRYKLPIRKIILLFFFLATYLGFAQTEIVLDVSNNISLLKARDSILTSENGYGTITIKRSLKIPASLDIIVIPHQVSLNFTTGSRLIIESSQVINIHGSIKSGMFPIFELPLDHKLKIHNQEIFPEWFGEFRYQGANIKPEEERNNIQKAFKALIVGGIINLKGGFYHIDKTIDIETPGIIVNGRSAYLSRDSRTNYIMSLNNEDDSTIFNIATFGVKINGLNFKGPQETNKGIDAKGIALSYIRSNGTKDLDASVRNCMFEHFRHGIYGEGANLKVTDNTFTACYIGIYINQAKQEGIDRANTRGHIIDRNRFHSIGSYLSDKSLDGSTCIKIWGTEGYFFPNDVFNNKNPESYWVRGYYNHISNNYADDCTTFFEGNLDRTKINGNSILASGGTAIKAFGGVYGAITNNTIDGSFTWNPFKLYGQKAESSSNKFPSGHGIHIKYAHFLTIHNNQILNKRFHGIYVERSRNTSIQSNTIMNFNRHRFIKEPNKEIEVNDDRIYDGIHIEKIQGRSTEKYNINNVVANNVISIPHTSVEGRYAIYIGDGDRKKLVTNNFINDARIQKDVKIER